jgi:simple sugar transport system permease protein
MSVFDAELLRSTIRLSTPLLLAALGGVLSERSGVINIALEGMMLAGAFFGMLGSHITGSAWIGLLFGMVAGMTLGIIHAFLTQSFKVNQVVSGIALNIFALGVTTYLLRILFQHAGGSPPINGLPTWHLGQTLGDQNILSILAFTLVIPISLFLFRSPLGLRLRAAGENPSATTAAGINFRSLRYLALTCSGILGGLGGVYLSLGQLNMFTEGMSSGRGFIALAAVIFGKWTPWGAAIAALFFGFSDALQMRLQGQTIFGHVIPAEFMLTLPYVLTIIALVGFVGKAIPPAALGQDD